MFTNIGKKIKALAQVIFWITVIGAVVGGIVIMVLDEDLIAIGLAVGAVGFLLAWISAMFLYGFGELIDKVCDIERNTRGNSAVSTVQANADYERIKRLEKLRAQGLITEEEFRQKMPGLQ